MPRRPYLDPEQMSRLTLDQAREALPDLEELRPLFDHLLARSDPDPSRAWSGSGELGTVGSRLVDTRDLMTWAGELASAEAERLATLYRIAAQALTALAAGRPAAAAEALLEAAALEERRERPERAAAYAEAAYRISRPARDHQRLAALALRRWARAERAWGRLDVALERYRHAYTAAAALSDARGAAEAAIGAGNVLEDQGRWGEAATWYSTALTSLEESSDPAPPERWQALLDLHIAARSRGELEESAAWLEQAQQALGPADREVARPYLENAAGQLLMARGAFDEAESRFRAALEHASGARARVTIGINLAESLLAQGRTLDAAEQARESEREAISARLVPKLPEVYRLLGRVASAEGNPDAFVLFERALEIARERHLPALEEALTFQAYADAEARRGDSEAARRLREAARERFASLGIAHMRRTFADVFAEPSS